MEIKLYAMTCGHVTGDLGRLMEGGEGRIRLPVPTYLIEHLKGVALFDSGMHPDCQSGPAARVGARMTGLFDFDYRPGEEVSARLTAIGCNPERVDILINSHFHFDQLAGNALIPNATMLVQRREWEAGMDPDIAAPHGHNRRDFDLGHKRLLIDGDHDVFGDCSVVCLGTYGHTPRHRSLRVRLDGGEIVLAADSYYFCRTLRERHLPRRVHDRVAMLASLDRLAALEGAGARIFYGHDPEFWQTVPQAPARIG